MICNDDFVLTVPKGSKLLLGNRMIVLSSIPEDAFDLWKKGERILALRGSSTLLENLSLEELKDIYKNRESHAFKVELDSIKKAIKSLEKSKETPIVKTNTKNKKTS